MTTWWKPSSINISDFAQTYFVNISLRTFDQKNAGFVRSERVEKVLEGKMSRRDIEQMMAAADTSHDGRIDYQG